MTKNILAKKAQVSDYLALTNLLSVEGSWVTPAGPVAAGDWAAVRDLARVASCFG